MTNGILILFHFLTFTFGFVVLIFISRKISSVAPSIRTSFINQALFYNLTIIFMTVEDFVILIYGKTLSYNDPLINGFRSLLHDLNLSFAMLWSLAFILLVYKLLGIQLNKKTRSVINFCVITVFVLLIYFFIASSLGITPYLLKYISLVLSYTILLVFIYSVYLYRKSNFIANENRKKALKVFSILFITFSLVNIIHLVNVLSFNFLPSLVSKFYIYFTDFLFNSIILFWGMKYLELLSSNTDITDLKNLSEEQLVSKFQISKRELDVIKLVGLGKSNQEIADLLFISLGTVKNHLYNIYLKLGIKSRTQLVKLL